MNDRQQRLLELVRHANPYPTGADLDAPRPSMPTARPRTSRWVYGAATVAVVSSIVGLTLAASRGPENPSVVARPDNGSTSTSTTIAPPPSSAVVVTADGTVVARMDDGGISAESGWEALVTHVLDPAVGDDAGLCSECTGDRITLTVDSTTQRRVEEAVAAWTAGSEIVAAVTVIDNASGALVAAAPANGGTFQPAATGQPGSLSRLYVAVAALEAGLDFEGTWESTSPAVVACDCPGDVTVRNSAGGSGGDMMSMRDALRLEVNTVFARIGANIGAPAITEAASALGLGPDRVPPTLDVVSGAGTIDTFDAARLLMPFVSGAATPPKVTDVGSPGEQTVSSIRQELANIPTNSGTAPRANLGPDGAGAIGITGTAVGYTDAWYVGATGTHTVAVHVFRADGGPLRNVTAGGETYSRVFGGTIPAVIWRDVVVALDET